MRWWGNWRFPRFSVFHRVGVDSQRVRSTSQQPQHNPHADISAALRGAILQEPTHNVRGPLHITEFPLTMTGQRWDRGLGGRGGTKAAINGGLPLRQTGAAQTSGWGFIQGPRAIIPDCKQPEMQSGVRGRGGWVNELKKLKKTSKRCFPLCFLFCYFFCFWPHFAVFGSGKSRYFHLTSRAFTVKLVRLVFDCLCVKQHESGHKQPVQNIRVQSHIKTTILPASTDGFMPTH